MMELLDAPNLIDRALTLEDKISNAPSNYNAEEYNDKTRSRIALVFVYGFFGTLIGALICLPIYNIYMLRQGWQAISLSNALSIISGIIGSPLGFVIGHYFKSDTK